MSAQPYEYIEVTELTECTACRALLEPEEDAVQCDGFIYCDTSCLADERPDLNL